MRGIGILLRQQIIKAMFRIVESVFGDLYSDLAEPRSSDGYEQSGNSFLSITQVLYPSFN